MIWYNKRYWKEFSVIKRGIKFHEQKKLELKKSPPSPNIIRPWWSQKKYLSKAPWPAVNAAQSPTVNTLV